MKQPDWASVIRVLYQRNGTVPYPDHDEDFESDNPLLRNTNLSESEIHDVTDYLKEIGLIELEFNTVTKDDGYTHKFRSGLSLTPKGFSVGHERELTNRQQELVNKQTQASHVVAALTVVLALSAATQVILGFQSLNLLYKGIVGLIALSAVLILAGLLYRVDII